MYSIRRSASLVLQLRIEFDMGLGSESCAICGFTTSIRYLCGDELCDTKQQESQEQEEKDHENCDVGSQGRNEEQKSEKTPQD